MADKCNSNSIRRSLFQQVGTVLGTVGFCDQLGTEIGWLHIGQFLVGVPSLVHLEGTSFLWMPGRVPGLVSQPTVEASLFSKLFSVQHSICHESIYVISTLNIICYRSVIG